MFLLFYSLEGEYFDNNTLKRLNAESFESDAKDVPGHTSLVEKLNTYTLSSKRNAGIDYGTG